MILRKAGLFSILIGLIICVGIFIPFMSLNDEVDLEKQVTGLSQLRSSERKTHQPSFRMSHLVTTTPDFSWSQNYEEYDEDSDSKIDTIELPIYFSPLYTGKPILTLIPS